MGGESLYEARAFCGLRPVVACLLALTALSIREVSAAGLPLTAWGYNFWGQSSVPPGLTNLIAMVAGYDHNVVVKSDGTVVAWGESQYGQTNVPPGLADVVAV